MNSILIASARAVASVHNIFRTHQQQLTKVSNSGTPLLFSVSGLLKNMRALRRSVAEAVPASGTHSSQQPAIPSNDK